MRSQSYSGVLSCYNSFFYRPYDLDRDPSVSRTVKFAEINCLPRTEKKLAVVRAEKTLKLFLNMHVDRVEKKGQRIVAVIARNVRTGREFAIRGITSSLDRGYLDVLVQGGSAP